MASNPPPPSVQWWNMTSSVSRRHPCHTSHASPSPTPATPISFSCPPYLPHPLSLFPFPCALREKKKKEQEPVKWKRYCVARCAPAVSKVNLPSCVCPSLKGSICHFILVFSQPVHQRSSTRWTKTSELKISAAFQYTMSPPRHFHLLFYGALHLDCGSCAVYIDFLVFPSLMPSFRLEYCPAMNAISITRWGRRIMRVYIIYMYMSRHGMLDLS